MGFNQKEIQDLKNSSCNCTPQFKIISFTEDELNCVYIDPDGQDHEIQANVWENNFSLVYSFGKRKCY